MSRRFNTALVSVVIVYSNVLSRALSHEMDIGFHVILERNFKASCSNTCAHKIRGRW